MDNASYLDVALRMANATLDDVGSAQAALHDEPWWADRVTDTDLRMLRRVAAGLRAVLAAAVAGDRDGVLRETNALLAAHPLRPRLSAGHDESEPHWHVHVADPAESPATEVAAAASWGIASGIVRHGLSRWGHCAADGCANFYLDTSTNQAKRFCSARCANRVHVAAFRSRQR
ncbi:MAG TPA: CGNR zinc finger domain-containing protein [Actinophytocola sp.]|uniref:CGNR zinc finger domain-containing protein n=1 Tax=Actinophytocola sp. TaxID=1872138 RepID=UPI002DB609DC|nr:CGNR zinc finger domain-containing protein [Actinophytocola sp.]HEU5475026.1 CGNR zinc finger domain-containing protein [Actinophytocola sp.]